MSKVKSVKSSVAKESNLINFKSKKAQADEALCDNIIELAMNDERILVKWLAGVLADCKRDGNEEKANVLIDKALEEKTKRLKSRILLLSEKE